MMIIIFILYSISFIYILGPDWRQKSNSWLEFDFSVEGSETVYKLNLDSQKEEEIHCIENVECSVYMSINEGLETISVSLTQVNLALQQQFNGFIPLSKMKGKYLMVIVSNMAEIDIL